MANRRPVSAYLCALLLFWAAPSLANTGSVVFPDPPRHESRRPYWRRNLFRRVLEDQRFIVTTWGRSEAGRTGFAIPLLASVAAGNVEVGGDSIDVGVERWLSARTGGGGKDAADAFSRLGDAEVGVLLVGSTYLLSRWAGNDRLSRASSLSAEALVNAAIYSTLLKSVTRRARPSSGGTGEFFVDRPEPGQSVNSFPSGHAMGAMAVATVVALEYRDRRWVPWLAYGTAGLIGISRVAEGHHFPSDVAVGMILGHSLGRMVVHRNGGEDGPPFPGRLEPIVDPRSGAYGLGYRRRW